MKLFQKDYRLQKTVRILVYPNITFQKNLGADSFIQVAKKQIQLLNEILDDLWFYIILPKPVESLNFDNVTQWYVDFETYPPTMRSNFRVDLMKKMFNYKIDFDLVMSHLPEHTHQLVNTLYNVTHHIPPVFGYSHWTDVKQVVAWPKDSFLQNMTGLLEYDRCYLNTQYQKDLVINQAKETFNDNIIKKLNDILQVQHLGVDEKDIVHDINMNTDKLIVFNHRPDTYKHFKQFISLMDKLWEQRKDFKVWIPLLEKPNRDYVMTDKGDKKYYYDKLKKCRVGFSPKQKYGGWSVATTDGMMNGTPYIMYNDTYYKELYSEGMFFNDDNDALHLLNKLLDDNDYRNKKSKDTLEYVKLSLVYKKGILEMNEYMNNLLSRQKIMGNSDALNKIVNNIKKNKSMTKREVMSKLDWGRGIKWTPYRRALMNHPNIYDVNDYEPSYIWRDK